MPDIFVSYAAEDFEYQIAIRTFSTANIKKLAEALRERTDILDLLTVAAWRLTAGVRGRSTRLLITAMTVKAGKLFPY